MTAGRYSGGYCSPYRQFSAGLVPHRDGSALFTVVVIAQTV